MPNSQKGKWIENHNLWVLARSVPLWRKTWSVKKTILLWLISTPNKLRALQDKFDLQVVHGHSAHPDILKKAGAEDADMIIAVTNSDEVNIVACQVAYSIFNTPTKVARIRTNQYIKYRDQLFNKDDMPVDHFIAPKPWSPTISDA